LKDSTMPVGQAQIHSDDSISIALIGSCPDLFRAPTESGKPSVGRRSR
jgi:hypothetical protein